MTQGNEGFLKAYHEFRDHVDFSKGGLLPEPDTLVWYLLMPFPKVPADDEDGEDALFHAIDQRVSILKAVFVELNRDQDEVFLDRGLSIYDQRRGWPRRSFEPRLDPLHQPLGIEVPRT